ncbi:MAG: nicotinate-nucleotide--dimethylbenzimidazole phosphoribosyltransferase [Spirochaetales bacterium]|nr:nicotinate-nucleotide--dimethylbenzimidazole phosphoribosyltransferase [Spirochaetales bacterium]
MSLTGLSCSILSPWDKAGLFRYAKFPINIIIVTGGKWMPELLEKTIGRITDTSRAAEKAALMRQNLLTKPAGSLGMLEAVSIRLAGIYGTEKPVTGEKLVMVFAGDHGIAASGVSAYPQEVTVQMVGNFLKGGAAINVLSRHIGARILIVDMGVASDLEPHPLLRIRKIGYGTADISRGSAMGREQAVKAIEAGIRLFEEEVGENTGLFIPGEMGIGNTSAATAIAAAVTGRPVEEITGRGTGIDDERLKRKIVLIKQAIGNNDVILGDPIDIAAKLGGFEICGIAGAVLGAAALRVPVVLDGLISTSGALIADALCPKVRKYCFASHNSTEKGHLVMLSQLGLVPLLDLQLRLGEGTGAALAVPIIEAACKILLEMATFSEAGVTEKER